MPATENPTLSHPRLFRGWLVVAGAFAVTFVGFGSAYTFSAFVGSLQRDFGASRGSVSLVFSLAGFLYFGLAVVVGVGMALMIANDPRDRGLAPDGAPLRSSARAAAPAGASLRQAIRS